MAKFATICHSKQVNLDTGVDFNTSVARGLIEEATCINADFLLVGHSRNRISLEITRYCFEHAPEGCSVVSVAKSQGNDVLSNREKQQPLLRCFSDKEIAKATKNFHRISSQEETVLPKLLNHPAVWSWWCFHINTPYHSW